MLLCRLRLQKRISWLGKRWALQSKILSTSTFSKVRSLDFHRKVGLASLIYETCTLKAKVDKTNHSKYSGSLTMRLIRHERTVLKPDQKNDGVIYIQIQKPSNLIPTQEKNRGTTQSSPSRLQPPSFWSAKFPRSKIPSELELEIFRHSFDAHRASRQYLQHCRTV